MAVTCMCNASGHNDTNSSFIVELAIGQIPCFTEIMVIILITVTAFV